MTTLMKKIAQWSSSLRAVGASRRKMSRTALRGMTLVEIMVVVAIIGLLTAAVATAVIPAYNKAKQDKAKTDIFSLMSSLKTYYIRAGKYPDTGSGLKVLESQQYIEKLEKDPWGNDYIYTLQSGKPVIMSYGADGQAGGEGFDADISSADNGASTDNKK